MADTDLTLNPPSKVQVQPVEPIEVTVIGTPGQKNVTPMVSGVTAVTPDHLPNIVVNVVQPIAAIAIRFVNSYLTVLVGLVTAGMVSNIIPATDFVHLVLACAKLSLAGAGLAAMKDLVTVFGKLEQKYPLLTGSV